MNSPYLYGTLYHLSTLYCSFYTKNTIKFINIRILANYYDYNLFPILGLLKLILIYYILTVYSHIISVMRIQYYIELFYVVLSGGEIIGK